MADLLTRHAMIVEIRTYTLHIGKVVEFLRMYAQCGRAVQIEHLGHPLGYFTSEVGELNQVVHLWRYDDLQDRARRRAALENDPRWHAYRRGSVADGQLARQHCALLREVDFDQWPGTDEGSPAG